METDKEILAELDVFIKKRENVFALVTAICANSKKLTSRRADAFCAQLEHLDRLEKEFETIQDSILTLNSKLRDPSQAVDTTKVALSFYGIVWDTRATAGQFEMSSGRTNAGAAPPDSQPLSLTPVQIPPFDGTGNSWTEFKAHYDQMIHNNGALTTIQKFYYLKTLVVGEASKVITNLDLVAENYPIAYAALTRRYASKRRIANRHVCDILNFRSTGKEREFLTVHENAVRSLKAMGLPDLGDYILFRLCYENLSPRMQYLFDDRCDSQTVPSCQELFDFVLHYTHNAEIRQDSSTTSAKAVSRIDKPTSFTKRHTPKTFLTKINKRDDSPRLVGSPPTGDIVCPVCKGKHLIYSCVDFLKSCVPERREIVKRLERCLNCLGQHSIKTCRSKHTCHKCGERHHSFLHSDTEVDKETASTSPRCHFLNAETSSIVILGTFLAQIQDSEGQYHQIRGVVDPASQVSAITRRLARRLGLKPKEVECSVSGLANSASSTKEKLDVSLRSCLDDQSLFRFSAYVFPNICQELPSRKITAHLTLDHLQGLELADPSYDEPGAIDLLLSAEMSAAILSTQTPNLIVGRPTAIRSVFGWILYGSVPVVANHSQFASQTLFTLREHLDKFWEVEEVPHRTFTSPEDDWCESHFLRTHSRDHTGRYTVSLPFRPDQPPLGNNKEIALKRWLRLEKKLLTTEGLHEAYNTVLQEYLTKNHMEVATTSSSYLLPHHAVTKVSSTTKLRVVFDASAKDSSGLSVNDRLLAGPKLQKDITHIISCFRSFRYALCGDISQMYRMIWLDPADRYCQHILWRKSPDFEVTEFELRTLTFGLAPAPFLAQRVIQQLIRDEGSKYPLASSALAHHTYIDDIITGIDSVEEGKMLQGQLIELLARGGFHLRKWCSNISELLRDVPQEDLETPLAFPDGSYGLKVLGLFWNPDQDIFTYRVEPFAGEVTKRTILSFIARIYDPMGWLAPVVILVKCLLQKLWLLKLDWDICVPEPLREEWSSFCFQFGTLCHIQIPRQLNTHLQKNRHRYNLIGFCDASEAAYAACVYLQNTTLPDSPLTLLQAKTKVAPLKSMTIPCLELSGALLLVRLVQSMTTPFPIQEIFYFTDSQIVLTWLQTPLHNLKIFVANRVSQILENTKVMQWKHIPGERNPADIASRGLLPGKLSDSVLWWNGPEDLSLNDTWTILPASEVPELKINHEIKLFFMSAATWNFVEFCERYSSWIGLQRILAWMFRFYRNCKFRAERCSSRWISVQELKGAKTRIVFLTQSYYLNSEMRAVENGLLPRALKSLDPFLDNSGCLRVGGRLRHSQLDFAAKHPLLLPHHSHVATLVVRHYHEFSLHSGPSTVQALIQQEFWIPGLRNLIRRITFSCVRCHRLKASTLQPKMGDLPVERVTMARPFVRTATDFAGPFPLKESLRRNAKILKCYLCIFICLVTKAVHLEVVTSLSTEAFLATFVRFISRRGLPAVVLSDNGRNYVGASRELKDLQTWLQNNEDQISSALASKSINWKFNPPEAPNFGGLFEAAIKSTKLLLHRLVGTQAFTYEEYTTLFQRIEAILNSRPLTRLSNDPKEDYLAPSHFLVGGLLHHIPEEPQGDTPLQSRWKRVQQLGQAFWRRWSTHYLHQLIQRPKWQQGSTAVTEGDLVYLKTQATSPLTWPLGKVLEVFPGKDGIVRVVSVRTAAGTYLRPANKLVRLPLA